MNVVNIIRRDYRDLKHPHKDIKLGVVTASPPLHAFQEAYRDYSEQSIIGKLDFKEFKAAFRETKPGTKIADFGSANLAYVLAKEKVN